MPNNIDFNIRLKLSDFGKSISKAVKNIKPVKVPVQAEVDPATEFFKDIASKQKQKQQIIPASASGGTPEEYFKSIEPKKKKKFRKSKKQDQYGKVVHEPVKEELDFGDKFVEKLKKMQPEFFKGMKLNRKEKRLFTRAAKHKPVEKSKSTGDILSEMINSPKSPLSKTNIAKTFDKYRIILGKHGDTMQKNFHGVLKGMSERLKNAGGSMKESWTQFNAELSDARGMGDALSAFRGLGDGVVKAFTSMSKPIAGWIMLIAAVTKKLTDCAKELEDARHSLNQSFKRGGRMAGVSAEKYTGMYSFTEDQMLQGNINRSEFLKSVGNARASSLSLDEKTFDKAVTQSIDLGAYLGVSKGEALEQYTKLLNDVDFSFEKAGDFADLFTAAEFDLIDGLKQAGDQAEANAIIMQKVAERTKGAQEEYQSTLSGKWEEFGNLVSSTLQNLGEILMPYMKQTMDFLNFIMKIINFISKVLADVFKMFQRPLAKLAKMLTGYDFGVDIGSEEQNEKQKDGQSGDQYIDPRIRLNTRFEAADSIVKNIQKGIMDQSPQAKMVNYLKDINDKLGGVATEQKTAKTVSLSQESVENLGREYRKYTMVGGLEH